MATTVEGLGFWGWFVCVGVYIGFLWNIGERYTFEFNWGDSGILQYLRFAV